MNSKNLVASFCVLVMVPFISPASLAKSFPVKESNGDAIAKLLKISNLAEECEDDEGNKIFCNS